VGYDWKTELPGIVSRHVDGCPVRDGGECTCGPLGYRASVRDPLSNERTVSPIVGSIYEALDWQRSHIAPTRPRVALASREELGALIEEFLAAAEGGQARAAGGAPYSHDEIRALRGALSYVDSELGSMSVQDVRRRHVQALVGQLRASGVPPGRVTAVLEALRALYADAIRRDIVGFSPLVELELADDHAVGSASVSSNGTAPDWGVPPTDQWTPPQAVPSVGPPWTPPPFPTSYPTPQPTPPAFPTGSYSTPQPSPPYTYPTWYPPTPPQQTRASGPLSAILGSPGQADADYDSTMQERWLWWTVRIIVIVFVLIALVLVAESV
jgi:hypothetical protein